MDVNHWHKYSQDLVIEIVGVETKIRVFMYFLALHHSILWVFEYLIKNAFIRRRTVTGIESCRHYALPDLLAHGLGLTALSPVCPMSHTRSLEICFRRLRQPPMPAACALVFWLDRPLG